MKWAVFRARRWRMVLDDNVVEEYLGPTTVEAWDGLRIRILEPGLLDVISG